MSGNASRKYKRYMQMQERKKFFDKEGEGVDVKESRRIERSIRRASRFKHLQLARSYAAYCTTKSSAILLGDDGLYWVLPLDKAELLHRHGYKYAQYAE